MAKFDIVIVTAPNVDIANVYKLQLSQYRNNPCLHGCSLYCVADPNGIRIGSGGGTLNALSHLTQLIGYENASNSNILIIHSGGDSRRAPLNSVCGKAWTSLNGESIGDNAPLNPLMLLMEEISSIFENFHQPVVVVASSDVMLDFDQAVVNITKDSVSIVAVPEIAIVAKNHGVLIAQQNSCELATASKAVILPIFDYLQKPSLPEMTNARALYSGQSVHLNNAYDYASIDTGVVVFSGQAALSVLNLAVDPVCQQLVLCTSSSSSSLSASDSGSSQGHTVIRNVRVELYSEMLLSLTTLQCSNTFVNYLSKLKLLEHTLAPDQLSVLRCIWTHLHCSAFHVIFIPHGQFSHLGTSQELLEFMSNTLQDAASEVDGELKFFGKHSKNQRFARKYHLKRVVGALAACEFVGCSHVIAIQSICASPAGLAIAEKGAKQDQCSLLEHSVLPPHWSLGRNSIVSHVRGGLLSGDSDNHSDSASDSDSDSAYHVRDNVMVQQVCLRTNWRTILQSNCGCDTMTESCESVLIVLATTDDCKAHYTSHSATVCGCSWQSFMELTGYTAEDIWPGEDEANRSLWTARLYAVGQNMLWLQDLKYAQNSRRRTVDKLTTRLSLSQLLVVGDAAEMWRWRLFLSVVLQSPTGIRQTELRDLLVIFKLCDDVCVQLGTILCSYNSTGCQLLPHSLVLSLWCACLCIVRTGFDVNTAVEDVVKLWAAETCCRPCELSDAGAVLSQIACKFVKFWLTISCHQTDDMCHLAGTYLKTLCCCESVSENLWREARTLINCAAIVPAATHPRLLLIAGWLLDDKDGACSTDDSINSIDTINEVDEVLDNLLTQWNHDACDVCVDNLSEACARRLTLVIRAGDRLAVCGAQTLSRLATFMETLAQRVVSMHIQASLKQQHSANPSLKQQPEQRVRDMSRVVLARAPVRVDLAGGWSDTPPVCYEMKGAVLNVAVAVDNCLPIQCAARFISEPVILLKTLFVCSDGKSGARFGGDVVVCRQWSDFDSASDPMSRCALLKAAMLVLGITEPPTSKTSTTDNENRLVAISLSEYLLNRLGGGIEVACVSCLPAGSGVGGSSVLAAAVLRCVSALLDDNDADDAGEDTASTSSHHTTRSREMLTDLVSQVEQVLTTGGGWQDQVGAIYGGFKLGTSSDSLPLTVAVHTLDALPRRFIKTCEQRMFLIYTGQQRLAKNTLINALKRFAITPVPMQHEDVATAAAHGTHGLNVIMDLSSEARAAHERLRLLSLKSLDDAQSAEESYGIIHDEIDNLATTVTRYWELKKRMAAGSDPAYIHDMFEYLKPIVAGYSLCGAGGGGYAVVFVKRSHTRQDLAALVKTYSEQLTARQSEAETAQGAAAEMTVHEVSVDDVGIDIQHVQLSLTQDLSTTLLI